MKRVLCILAVSMIAILSVSAKAQSGATTGTITDNSLVFKGYYQGETQTSDDNAITLTFYNKDGQDINHDHQGGSTGTKVNAGTSHQDSSTDTIFTWSMEGTTTDKVTLGFTFSTMQAQVNGKYFRPTYIIKMTQNSSKKKVTKNSGNPTESDYNGDPFYSSTERTVVSLTKGSNDAEYIATYTVSYSGKATGTGTTTSGGWFNQTTTRTSWYRSGTCTLNISDYEKDKPGDYVYSCWVIAEVTVE